MSGKNVSSATVDLIRRWINDLTIDNIPRDLFKISTSTSSGPGGQNVNRVNSKVTIRLPFEQLKTSTWFPDYIKLQLLEEDTNKFPYFTKSGTILIQSDSSRSQQENLTLCYTKFCHGLKRAIFLPTDPDPELVDKWKKIMNKSNEKRLNEKKLHQNKKRERRVDF
jgi:peptidyl-tRNA hydrolase ICT1